MKCQNCQKELTPEDQICPNCGVPTVNRVQEVVEQVPVQEEVMEVNNQVQEEAVMEPAPSVETEPPVKLKKPKKNKSPIPVILLIVIILGAIGALVYFYGGEYLNLEPTKKDESHKIIYKGMEIYIPNKYTYEIRDNYILLSDDTNTWEAKIEKFYTHNYLNYKGNHDYIKEKLINLNYEVLNYKTEEYTKENKDIILAMFETVIEQNNILIGILEKDSENGIIISIIRNDNTYDYEILEKLTPVINSITFPNITMNNSTDNITINEILDRATIETDIPDDEELVIDGELITPPQTETEIVDPNTEVQNELENIPTQ